MRLFVAIDLPGDLKEKLHEVQKKLYDIGIVRWVKKEQFHITLKFIGNADVNKVLAALSKLKFKPFRIKVKGMGFFPNSNYIRVIWIGAHSKEMEELASQINDLLKDVVPPEEFVGHITIGRVKKIDKSKLKGKKIDIEYEFICKEVVLYQSILTKNGPVYRVVRKYEADNL